MAYEHIIKPQTPDTPVDRIDRVMEELSLAVVPMGWAVEIIPALKYPLEDFLGIRFETPARKWRKINRSVGLHPM
jgi:hypothetical protein